MKIRNLLILALLLLATNVFSQNITIQNVNIKVDDGMLELQVPKMQDNVTRMVEISRIQTDDVPKTGNRNSLKQSVKNCESTCKTMLVKGEYIFKVTVRATDKKDYSEEQRFVVL